MTTPYLTRDFPAVDETEDVGSFVRYLDAVTNLDAVRRYKLRTFELLGVHVGDRCPRSRRANHPEPAGR